MNRVNLGMLLIQFRKYNQTEYSESIYLYSYISIVTWNITMLELANSVRKKRAFENKWHVYEIINKKPGLTIYDLSKLTEWSVGKIEYYVKKLVKDGVLENSTEILNGRVRKAYFPTPMKKLVDWNQIEL